MLILKCEILLNSFLELINLNKEGLHEILESIKTEM